MAALRLPYDISVQVTGTYNSRQVITQGHRPASYVVDMGVRKNFLNRMFTLSVNCRDLLNSRKWESYTNSETFYRYQLNKRRSRTVNFTLTWNFGNQSAKKKPMEQQQEEEDNNMGGYEM